MSVFVNTVKSVTRTGNKLIDCFVPASNFKGSKVKLKKKSWCRCIIHAGNEKMEFQRDTTGSMDGFTQNSHKLLVFVRPKKILMHSLL